MALRFRVVFLLVIAAAMPVAAQTSGTTAGTAASRIGPDSPDIDGTRVQPGRWDLHYVETIKGVRGDSGIMHFELERTTVDGKAVLRVVQGIESSAGVYADTSLVLASSFQSLENHSHNADRSVTLKFDGTHVTGTITPTDGDPKPVDQTMPAPAFDAGMLALVLGALPLKEGYSGTLAAWVTEAGVPINVGFRVTARTMVEAEGGRREAWLIEAFDGRARFWFDTVTRQVLRNEVRSPDGSSSTLMVRRPKTGGQPMHPVGVRS